MNGNLVRVSESSSYMGYTVSSCPLKLEVPFKLFWKFLKTQKKKITPTFDLEICSFMKIAWGIKNEFSVLRDL